MDNDILTTDYEKLQAEQKAFDAKYLPLVPKWAKAVIVATLKKDQSDLMSDYHGSTTTKTIILGFSKHTRDLFPEMRKLATNHEETAFLKDAPKESENREKYSMGGGYYLKNGYRHDNGWQISKKPFYDGRISLPVGEWAVKK